MKSSERCGEERRAPEGYRCGYVALAGRPNVGKSTLLNAVVGAHLSIVSPLPQTTRERVTGILTTDAYQIAFLDAPGLLEPRHALQEVMRWAADRAIEDADLVAFLSDASKPNSLPKEAVMQAVADRSVSILVAINKCDLVDRETEARLVREVASRSYDCVAISAVTGTGLEEFRERVVPQLPEAPPLFPPDHSAVESIKKVGEVSRRKIEELLGQRVYLDLRVKAMGGWPRKRGHLEHLGFRLPPESRSGQKGV